MIIHWRSTQLIKFSWLIFLKLRKKLGMEPKLKNSFPNFQFQELSSDFNIHAGIKVQRYKFLNPDSLCHRFFHFPPLNLYQFLRFSRKDMFNYALIVQIVDKYLLFFLCTNLWKMLHLSFLLKSLGKYLKQHVYSTREVVFNLKWDFSIFVLVMTINVYLKII